MSAIRNFPNIPDKKQLKKHLVCFILSPTLALSFLLVLLLIAGASANSAKAELGDPSTESPVAPTSDIGEWYTETIVNALGYYNSLALAPTAPYTPYLGYQDNALWFAQWTPTGWVTETVDESSYDAGKYLSLALEPTPPYTAHISYHDYDNGNLKHAWWTPGGWISETVDSSSYEVGLYTSIALEPVPPYTTHISYYDAPYERLKHAWWTPTGWMSETVDNDGDVGKDTSIALEPLPPYYPHISYYDRDNSALKHARLTPDGWMREIVDNSNPSGRVGEFTSLAIAPSPPYTIHISYYEYLEWKYGNLKHAWMSGSTWYSETVDTGGDLGRNSSIALEALPPHTPHIGFIDETNDNPMYAWLTPAGWMTETVDHVYRLAEYTSLALEPTPPFIPHLVYKAIDDGKHQVFHASIIPQNQAPIADAGVDQFVGIGQLVTLDGSESIDPDQNLPLTYNWEQTDGLPVAFNSILSVTTFTAPISTTVLTFSLSVTDALGLASIPDEVIVFVQQYMYLPIVVGGTEE